MKSSNLEPPWALEREIVLSRVFDAPRELVFRAWTERDRITALFGPKGFVCTTHEMDVRVGGMWRFDLVAPDGTTYHNRIAFLEVTPPERLVFDHGSDEDDDPNRFRVTITFDRQGDAKTVVMLRQLHPSQAQRDATLDSGAVELGYQSLDRLAEYLRQSAGA